MTSPPELHSDGQTRLVRTRYDRIAPLYDVLEWPMERSARHWRRQLWSRVTGGRILELGVGWNPELDAIDNIYLLGSVMGLSLSAIRASLDDILAFAEVERFARLPLKHYSSGMASRLAYAVAFRAVRDVLVLDEIFAVGDAGFRLRCEARYQELHRAGHTMVIVSHDPRVITTFCNRAILLDGGRIVAEGSGSEIAERYLSAAVAPDHRTVA